MTGPPRRRSVLHSSVTCCTCPATLYLACTRDEALQYLALASSLAIPRLAIPRTGKQRHPGGWQHHAHRPPQPPPQAATGTERITWLQPSPGTVCPTATQVGSPPVPAQRGRRCLAPTRSAARPAPALLQQRHSGGPRSQRRLLQAHALGSPQCPVQRRGARQAMAPPRPCARQATAPPRPCARQATAPPRPCARPARPRPRAAGSRRPWRRAWGCAGTGSPRPRCGTRTTPPCPDS